MSSLSETLRRRVEGLRDADPLDVRTAAGLGIGVLDDVAAYADRAPERATRSPLVTDATRRELVAALRALVRGAGRRR